MANKSLVTPGMAPEIDIPLAVQFVDTEAYLESAFRKFSNLGDDTRPDALRLQALISLERAKQTRLVTESLICQIQETQLRHQLSATMHNLVVDLVNAGPASVLSDMVLDEDRRGMKSIAGLQMRMDKAKKDAPRREILRETIEEVIGSHSTSTKLSKLVKQVRVIVLNRLGTNDNIKKGIVKETWPSTSVVEREIKASLDRL